MTLAGIPVLATVVAFGVLDAGRRLVKGEGTRAVRRTLVRESDQVVSRALGEIEQERGCRPVAGGGLRYRRCVAVTARGADTATVSIRIEPANRLVAPDSMRYVVARGAR